MLFVFVMCDCAFAGAVGTCAGIGVVAIFVNKVDLTIART